MLSAILLFGMFLMTFASYRELSTYSTLNAETRLDRASITSAVLFRHWFPQAERWEKDANGTPSRIVLSVEDPGWLAANKQKFAGLIQEIAQINQGAANIFTFDKAAGDFDRTATTFRKPDGSDAPAFRLKVDHPAYANLSAGQAHRGDVPVMGRMRYAFLIPLNSASGALLGALAVDVGWSDDLATAKTSLQSKLIAIASVLGLVFLAAALFVTSLLRAPITALSTLINGTHVSKAAVALASKSDDVGQLARGIQELKQRATEMREMARIDALTGLGNRAHFDETLERTLAAQHRTVDCCYLMLLDLDHFKCVNDELGHPAGDAVLRETAARLKAILPRDVQIMRNGGDEFAVIGEIKDVWHVARQILSALKRPIVVENGEAHVDVSIGIVQIDGAITSEKDLYGRADIALYHSKKSGRGAYTFYSDRISAAGGDFGKKAANG